MPATMKVPTVCEPPGDRVGWELSTDPASALGGRPIYSYTYGRLRPRLRDRGAWHELWCLVPGGTPPRPGTEDLDRLLVKAFGRDAQGQRPDAFFLARELVWPLEDALGVPQCVVVPRSDEQIMELLDNLCPSAPPCAGTGYSVVHGVLSGFVEDLGGDLSGLPEVDLVSAFPFDIDQSIRSGAGDDRTRLFRAYQPLLANNGIGDELRAMNYLLTRSEAFYELASRLDERSRDGEQEHRLIGIHPLSVDGPAAKPRLDLVFSFQNGQSAVRRWFQRVDVGGPFMFFSTEQVQPFYSRPVGAVTPQWSRGLAPSQEAEERAEADPAVLDDVDGHASDAAPEAPADVASGETDAQEPADVPPSSPPERSETTSSDGDEEPA